MPNQFFSPEGDLENYFVTEYWLIDQWVGDELWVWGYNIYGQIGNGIVISGRNTPVTTTAGGNDWKQVSMGNLGNFTTAIKSDGTLWAWGRNNYGQTANATSSDRSTPVTTFLGGNNWRQVSGGGNHTAAIKTDGTLWTWGLGSSGQLGNAVAAGSRNTPITTFSGGTNWKQVSNGYAHTAAIKTDGTLWMWGLGSNAKLGNGQTTNRNTPVTTFLGGNNWKQVSCGENHTSAIKTDGTLWMWGLTQYGRLGNGITVGYRSTPVTTFLGGTNWKQVACGREYTSAIKTDGTLWTWGFANFGALGNGSTTGYRSTPVTTFLGGNNWKQVACGDYHTAAIKTDGTLWMWGYGSNGGLGNNLTLNRSTPVTTFIGGTNWKQVSGGSYHSAGVKSGITAEVTNPG